MYTKRTDSERNRLFGKRRENKIPNIIQTTRRKKFKLEGFTFETVERIKNLGAWAKKNSNSHDDKRKNYNFKTVLI